MKKCLGPRGTGSLGFPVASLGISFHAVVVFALGKNLLFKSDIGHSDCDSESIFPFDNYLKGPNSNIS